jgi:hypothetical protein
MTTTSRALPGLGITGGWTAGEDGWADGVNANWLAISVFTQARALDIVDAVPASPAQGDVYLLSASATANANSIAAYDNAAWSYFTAQAGFQFYVASKSAFYKFDGSAWTVISSGGGSGSDYTLPAATASTLGGVKVGTGLTVDKTGVLSWSASMTGYLSPYVFSIPTDTDRSQSTSSYNLKGVVLTVGAEDYTVKGVGLLLDLIANHTYKLAITTLNTDHSVNTIVATAEYTASAAATAAEVMFVFSSVVVLSAGTEYAFLVCDTSQTSGTAAIGIYGSNIGATTMTYFGLSVTSPWRAAATEIRHGLAMDTSNSWGEGAYFIGVMGAPNSILNSSVDTTAIANAVSAEAVLREAADATKVNKAGDIMSSALLLANPNPASTPGQTNYGPAVVSQADATTRFQLYAQETNGVSASGVLFLTSAGNTFYWNFTTGSRIVSAAGTTALTSELTTAGVISGGTYTKTPMNDGTGRSVLRQTFQFKVTPDSSGNVIASFPITFASVPNVIGLGSIDLSSGAAASIVVGLNSAKTSLGTTTSSVPLRCINGSANSTNPFLVTITVEGIVS